MILEVLFFTSLSFLIAYAIMPRVIKSLVSRGFLNRDVHKVNKPRVSEPGGIALVFSFTITILLYLALITYSNNVVDIDLLAGTLSIMVAGVIGLIDDLLNMKWRTKFLLAFLPALPLMVLKAGVSEMYIPLIGYVNFGIFYSLGMIPLMVNFAINEFNMIAGYNGLEAGMAIVSMATIIAASFLTGNADIAVLAASMLGGTIAFYLFNKYPAKTFPGDTGTFLWGCLLISALIIANMEKLALGIFFLYFLDFAGFLICLKKGCRAKFAQIDSKGNLRPSCGHRIYFFLPYFFPKLNLKENDITRILIIAQVLVCAVSLIIFF
jgi:UDP-N-acetylglucosamine--dolichyl-phosphate N-acetylglucosaminephosphotransferase